MRHWMILGLGLAACGSGSGGPDAEEIVDCSTIQGVDTFTVPLKHQGINGALEFQMMSAEPAPPARNSNTWIVQINSMTSGVVGNPVDGATFNVTPFMPAHQHGTPIPVKITPAGTSGQYTLDPVFFSMPGVWETTISVSSGATTDSAVYKFCIPS
jgi:YtkA-like